MFLVTFYGHFGSVNKEHASCIINHLTFHTRNGHTQLAKTSISTYKHNASNRPFDILTAREDSHPFCPVDALLQYCQVRGDRPGPLFNHADNSPISVNQFNSDLQRCLTSCGLDISRYKSHRFCICSAWQTADKAYSDARIHALGCW